MAKEIEISDSDQRQSPRRGLKMKDLVAATGVPKSTILHYLSQGLLPPPARTSRNMAYYDPACVERLTFIKVLQSKHRLPLAVIRRLLRDLEQARDVAPLVELSVATFGRQEDTELLDLPAFCRATGLTPPGVEELEAAGLLLPLEAERFDAEDVLVGRIFRRVREMGLTLEEVAYYPRLAAKIVDHEMAIRDRLIGGLSLEDNAALTLELTQAARALRPYIIDRVFQHRILARTKGLANTAEEP